MRGYREDIGTASIRRHSEPELTGKHEKGIRPVGPSYPPGGRFQDCRRTEPVYSGRCKPCFGEWRGAARQCARRLPW